MDFRPKTAAAARLWLAIARRPLRVPPATVVLLAWVAGQVAIAIQVFAEFNLSPAYSDVRLIVGNAIGAARAAATVASYNCALVFVPCCRTLISMVPTPQSYPSLKYVQAPAFLGRTHGYISWAIVFWGMVHVLAHVFSFNRIQRTSGNSSRKDDESFFAKYSALSMQINTGPGITGQVIAALLFIIAASSIYSVRKRSHSLFWTVHKLHLVFLGFLLIHGAFCFVKKDKTSKGNRCGNGPEFWKWILPNAVLYGVERLVRNYKTKRKVYISKVIEHPSNVVELQVKYRPPHKPYKAGQIVYLCCPEISAIEWHACTITSSPYDDHISIHMAATGEWSSRMAIRCGASLVVRPSELDNFEATNNNNVMLDDLNGNSSGNPKLDAIVEGAVTSTSTTGVVINENSGGGSDEVQNGSGNEGSTIDADANEEDKGKGWSFTKLFSGKSTTAASTTMTSMTNNKAAEQEAQDTAEAQKRKLKAKQNALIEDITGDEDANEGGSGIRKRKIAGFLKLGNNNNSDRGNDNSLSAKESKMEASTKEFKSFDSKKLMGDIMPSSLPFIMIDGPYGDIQYFTQHMLSHTTSVIIAAGEEMSSFASILKTVWYVLSMDHSEKIKANLRSQEDGTPPSTQSTPKTTTKLEQLFFIGIVKDFVMFEWFEELLGILADDPIFSGKFKIAVHILDDPTDIKGPRNRSKLQATVKNFFKRVSSSSGKTGTSSDDSNYNVKSTHPSFILHDGPPDWNVIFGSVSMLANQNRNRGRNRLSAIQNHLNLPTNVGVFCAAPDTIYNEVDLQCERYRGMNNSKFTLYNCNCMEY